MTTDPASRRYRYDRDDEPASVAVVRAVAEATDADVLELRPLQYVVDTDALDGILDRGADETRIRFSFAGCSVEASADVVVVRPDDGAAG